MNGLHRAAEQGERPLNADERQEALDALHSMLDAAEALGEAAERLRDQWPDQAEYLAALERDIAERHDEHLDDIDDWRVWC